jgi:hypothetical protein
MALTSGTSVESEPVPEKTPPGMLGDGRAHAAASSEAATGEAWTDSQS